MPLNASQKIKTLPRLKKILDCERSGGKKIVFTNGCFDILHYGHVSYLERARKLGDVLVVAINSDSSVKKIKGENRPLNSQRDRARVLSAISFVDYVTIFRESTPIRAIKQLKPDLLVKGEDWKKEEIVGKDFVESRGGEVTVVPYLKGYSTTSILESIRRCSQRD